MSTAELEGTRVLVGRAFGQAEELSRRIRARGGEVVHAPLLEIVPGDARALEAGVRELEAGGFAAVCLTSPNGVAAVARALRAAGRGPAALEGAETLACVGPGTAGALADELGVTATLVPDVATTRALAEAFPPGRGRVWLPRADIASPVLPRVLRAKGYEPVETTAYRTRSPGALPAGVLEDLAAGAIDVIAFASSSTVRSFAALVGDRPWRARVVSIGPVTSDTCAQLGIEVAVEAEQHDLDGLVAAIVTAAPGLGAGPILGG